MRVIVCILLALLISSCATKKQRAIKHVNKALRLDPEVLSEFNSPIRLDTTIIINKQVVTPEKKIYLPVNEDSLKQALEAKLGVKTMLVENDKLKLELKRTKDGWVEFLATVKPDTITVRDTVEIVIEKEVPVRGFKRTVVKKGYLYYCGILFNVFGIVFILGYLWRLYKK